MSGHRGTQGLQLWCKRITDGYPGVKVDNMTSSWRDGLAFCAIVHHFRPDLIDFHNLKKEDVYGNNELAFRVAEQYLGIPALLEAQDMVDCSTPDRLSILTYLSQYYQAFSAMSPAKKIPKRPVSSMSAGTSSPECSSPPMKLSSAPSGMAIAATRGRPSIQREVCAKCALPVFIAERLNVEKHLYHRTCFRCALCTSQLTLANYVCDAKENQYRCETCPDKEESAGASVSLREGDTYNFLGRSLSDEEKSVQRHLNTMDGNTTLFRTAMDTSDPNRTTVLSSEDSSEYTKARSSFFQSHLLDEMNIDDGDDDTATTYPIPTNRSANDHSSSTISTASNNDSFAKIRNSHIPEVISPISSTDESDTQINKRMENGGSHNGNHIKSSVISDLNDIPTLSDKNLSNDIKSDLPSPVKVARKNASKVPQSSNLKSNSSDMHIYTENNTVKNISDDHIIPLNKIEEIEKPEANRVSSSTEPCTNSLKENLSQNSSSIMHESQIVDIQPSIAISENIAGHPTSIECVEIKDAEVSVAQALPVQETPEPESDPAIIQQAPTVDLHPESSITESLQLEDNTESHTHMRSSCVDINVVDDRTESNKSSQRSSVLESDRSSEYPLDLNPFGDDDEEVNVCVSTETHIDSKKKEDADLGYDSTSTLKHTSGTKIQIRAPRISLNPFDSDCKSSDDDDNNENSQTLGKDTLPEARSSINHGSSLSSLSSMTSNSSAGVNSVRKKKPAPRIPVSTAHDYQANSPSKSVKSRAPLPPVMSTPIKVTKNYLTSHLSPINVEQAKVTKNEINETRRESSLDVTLTTAHLDVSDKDDLSSNAKWKRKKAPAPAKPVPIRRSIKELPIIEVKRELDIIEVQQQGLEKQGVKLEQLIRERCESGEDGQQDTETIPIEVDNLILQLFEVVNEKNDLCRRQAELMYLRKQHRLEEEYADIEYKIRCLMLKSEQNKTDSDKTEEEQLIERLVSVVERRNEIIQCLELDRRRETEEDNGFTVTLNDYVNRRLEESDEQERIAVKREKKKHKSRFKIKIGTLRPRSSQGKEKPDADKDIDETEECIEVADPEKKKKKSILNTIKFH